MNGSLDSWNLLHDICLWSDINFHFVQQLPLVFAIFERNVLQFATYRERIFVTNFVLKPNFVDSLGVVGVDHPRAEISPNSSLVKLHPESECAASADIRLHSHATVELLYDLFGHVQAHAKSLGAEVVAVLLEKSKQLEKLGLVTDRNADALVNNLDLNFGFAHDIGAA